MTTDLVPPLLYPAAGLLSMHHGNSTPLRHGLHLRWLTCNPTPGSYTSCCCRQNLVSGKCWSPLHTILVDCSLTSSKFCTSVYLGGLLNPTIKHRSINCTWTWLEFRLSSHAKTEDKRRSCQHGQHKPVKLGRIIHADVLSAEKYVL